MRSFLLLVFVTIFVVSVADALWPSRDRGKSSKSRGSKYRDNSDDTVEDDQPAETYSASDNAMDNRRGGDGKKCKRSWFRRKCPDNSDDNVEDDQPETYIGQDGMADSKKTSVKTWWSSMREKRKDKRKGDDGKKCKRSWLRKCPDNSEDNVEDDQPETGQNGMADSKKTSVKKWWSSMREKIKDKRKGDDGKKCKRSWLRKCPDNSDDNVEDDQPETKKTPVKTRRSRKMEKRKNNRKGEAGKKCKRSWFLGRCAKNSDDDVEDDQPAETEKIGPQRDNAFGNGEKKCKPSFWSRKKCHDDQGGNKKKSFRSKRN